METFLFKIDEIKKILNSRDIESIKKSKYKTIPAKDIRKETKKISELYNYYVKLVKKVKRYLLDGDCIFLETKEHSINKIVCLMIKIKKSEIEEFMKVDIRVLTGDTKDTYMNCTYYNIEKRGILYINEFTSGKPKFGYGKIILSNLDYIVNKINTILDYYNHYNDNCIFNYIQYIEGIAIPFKSIISQENLNKIYRKYGFTINEKDGMKIKKEIQIKECLCI